MSIGFYLRSHLPPRYLIDYLYPHPSHNKQGKSRPYQKPYQCQ